MTYFVSFLKVILQYIMPHCLAYACATHTGRLEEGVSIHAFPRDVHLCTVWVSRCGTDVGHIPTFVKEVMGSKRAKYYLCSKHFSDSMFEGNFMKQLLPPNFMKRQTRQRLKKNALPTKFSHTQNKERSSSSLRIAAQERKKLLDELLSTQPSTSDTLMQEMDDNHAQTELLLQDKEKDMMKEVEVTVGNNVRKWTQHVLT
ncbi:uncharacterized protein LOC122809140 [Protopterus annectens]|uniref:uncharacterized protein LOC122809140 n=1 Tax=Protopterus annectens TaxID=7888 RepID=UPI001CFB2687|nr:uncharacterized protein LOC122809140 [Protopterus annectens]